MITDLSGYYQEIWYLAVCLSNVFTSSFAESNQQQMWQILKWIYT